MCELFFPLLLRTRQLNNSINIYIYGFVSVWFSFWFSSEIKSYLRFSNELSVFLVVFFFLGIVVKNEELFRLKYMFVSSNFVRFSFDLNFFNHFLHCLSVRFGNIRLNFRSYGYVCMRVYVYLIRMGTLLSKLFSQLFTTLAN